METSNAAETLAALGHDLRLSVFRLLVEAGPEGLFPTFICEQLGMAPATLSFHLAHLSRVGLIRGQKESRFIRYSAEFSVINDLISFLTHNCCQGNACLPTTSVCNTPDKHLDNPSLDERTGMGPRVLNVLFLCTGNSARSILAEAILNHVGKGRFQAFSAGSHPTGQVNPLVLELLNRQGFPADGLRSKSWDEFAGDDTPKLDFVFTVCDKAAGEICPIWPGQPITAHWGIDDPAAVSGDHDARIHAVSKAFQLLNRRIGLFVNLPFEKLDALSLQRQLDDIGALRKKGE